MSLSARYLRLISRYVYTIEDVARLQQMSILAYESITDKISESTHIKYSNDADVICYAKRYDYMEKIPGKDTIMCYYCGEYNKFPEIPKIYFGQIEHLEVFDNPRNPVRSITGWLLEYFRQFVMIRTLRFHNLLFCTTIGVRFMYNRPALEEIDLRGLCCLISFNTQFAMSCTGLKRIDLTQCPLLREIGSFFCERCRSLEYIFMSGLMHLRKIGKYFLHETAIKAISLRHCRHLNEIDNNFCNIPTLAHVNLDYLVRLQKIGSHFLHDCSKIHVVDLSHCKSLQIIADNFLSMSPFNAKASQLYAVNLKGLVKLEWIGDYFLAGASLLKDIDLSDLPMVLNIGNFFMSKCSSIITIDLSRMISLRSVGNMFASGCTSLKRVYIPKSRDGEPFVYGDEFPLKLVALGGQNSIEVANSSDFDQYTSEIYDLLAGDKSSTDVTPSRHQSEQVDVSVFETTKTDPAWAIENSTNSLPIPVHRTRRQNIEERRPSAQVPTKTTRQPVQQSVSPPQAAPVHSPSIAMATPSQTARPVEYAHRQTSPAYAPSPTASPQQTLSPTQRMSPQHMTNHTQQWVPFPQQRMSPQYFQDSSYSMQQPPMQRMPPHYAIEQEQQIRSPLYQLHRPVPHSGYSTPHPSSPVYAYPQYHTGPQYSTDFQSYHGRYRTVPPWGYPNQTPRPHPSSYHPNFGQPYFYQ